MFPRDSQPSWRATAPGIPAIKKKIYKTPKHNKVDTSKVRARFAEGPSITIQFNVKLKLKIQSAGKIQVRFSENL